MSTALRNADDGALRQRFARLRRRLRLVTTFRGAGWLVALVLVTGALAGLLDWRLHLPALFRATVLLGLLVGAGLVALRSLLRPLGARTDDLALALRVEECYPHLNDSLASTVQFLETGPSSSASESLQREAVRRALGKAQGCDFNRVVDSRGLRPAVCLGVLSTVLTVVLVALSPAVASTAFLRLADPFGNHDWPRQTRLLLDDPKGRIGRNESYQVRGRVLGVVPSEAVLELSFEGFPASRKTYRLTQEEDGTGTLRIHLKPEEVQRNFRFRVLANDAATREYAVEVLPPPVLVSLDGRPSPQLRLHYPRYTDLPTPHDLPAGNGNIEAVFGTGVELRAAADRPLGKAWIEYLPELRETPVALFLAPLGAGSSLGTACALAGGRSVWAHVPATIESDPRKFHASFQPRIRGTYALHFEDETGLHNNRLFELRLQADPAPAVQMLRPSPSRDVLTMLPDAVVNLEVVADDPQFALKSLFLEYRTLPTEPPHILSLYDSAEGWKPAGPVAGVAFAGAPAPKLRPQRLEMKRTFPLKKVRHHEGRPLQEGDVVLLQACADDFDDVTPGKEPGRSHQVEIRIVGRPALDLALNQEQTRVQQELTKLRDKEREALQKVAAAEKKLRKGEKLTPEEQEQLLQAEQTQQQIRERVGDRKEGLRAEVARVQETLKQNGLKNSSARDRMEAVARELDRLAEQELEQIEPKLTNARKLAELLDEKTRQDRARELEQKARDAEREAKTLEGSARKDNESAARAEELAQKASDEQEQKRQEALAQKLRERAAEAEKKARELREQAARDRRDAGQTPDEKQPREALAEARRMQEEVEKTLGALLQEMEPWSSTREVKGEAGRLLQEQKALQNELEELAQKEKEQAGKRPEELTPQQKADLENLRDAQQRLEQRANQLLTRMKRQAEERAGKDPETARELQQAAEKAEQGALTGKMQEAAERIKRNELNAARKSQQEALAELQKLAKNLEDRREAELDRLIKKLREAEEKVEKLIQEQERLKKKAEEASKLKDPDKRDEELKKLARQQKEVQQQTKEVLDQLSRLRSARANQALDQAREEMEQATQQLTRGQRDDEKQEDVLDRLDEAKEELERARKQAEEELGREQLARVADIIKRLRERQEGLIKEASRIQTSAQQNNNWTRGLKASLRDLGENQKKGLAEETLAARKELVNVPVFSKILERAADAMKEAGDRAGAMFKELPPVKDLPDVELKERQELALRRLTQLLEAVKESQEDPKPLSGGAGGQGEEGGGRGGPEDRGLPPPAQLKLLRGMQKEVNDRTEAFRQKNPDPDKLGRKEKVELKAIQKEQKEVADLLEQLLRPADEAKDKADEAKEKEGDGR